MFGSRQTADAIQCLGSIAVTHRISEFHCTILQRSCCFTVHCAIRWNNLQVMARCSIFCTKRRSTTHPLDTQIHKIIAMSHVEALNFVNAVIELSGTTTEFVESVEGHHRSQVLDFIYQERSQNYQKQQPNYQLLNCEFRKLSPNLTWFR